MTEQVSDQVKMARDLRSIKELAGNLEEQALSKYAAKDMPGGDAMVMLGPSANMEAYSNRTLSSIMGRTSGIRGRVDDPDGSDDWDSDPAPPLLVLASWVDLVREAKDQPTALKATIEREVDYLASNLDWLYGFNEDDEPNYLPVEELAIALRKLRGRMENVLMDGYRAEWTRVNCIAPECESNSRLMKIWASQVRWDGYKCPDCRTDYNQDQFMQAMSQNLHDEGASRFVRPIDAMRASGVPKNTMKSWIRRGDVATSREVSGQGKRQFVWWPDVRERAVERSKRRSA